MRGKDWENSGKTMTKAEIGRWIFKDINARQALLCMMDEGKPIRTERGRGRDGQWQREELERQITTEGEKRGVKERDVVIPPSWMRRHSGVNSPPSNPIWSAAQPAVTHADTELGKSGGGGEWKMLTLWRDTNRRKQDKLMLKLWMWKWCELCKDTRLRQQIRTKYTGKTMLKRSINTGTNSKYS